MAVLKESEARNLSIQILTSHGFKREQADLITDILIAAELHGRPTHGLIRLKGIIGNAEKRDIEIEVEKETENYALVNGNGCLGYIAAYYAMNLALKKARKHGIALVGVKNSGHCGMAGYYVRMALQHDCIGIMICNTHPKVVVPEGKTPVFGTNPIAVAVPSMGEPLVLDMSIHHFDLAGGLEFEELRNDRHSPMHPPPSYAVALAA